MAAFTRQFTVHYAKDNSEGETFWPTIGRAFEDKKRITIKIDSLPIGTWDGRIFLYEIKPH